MFAIEVSCLNILRASDRKFAVFFVLFFLLSCLKLAEARRSYYFSGLGA